jgi:hypothetical protein
MAADLVNLALGREGVTADACSQAQLRRYG